MKRFAGFFFVLAATASSISGAVGADEVTDWNGIMLQAAHDAVPPTSPLVMTRVAAIVQASVFDAVNGIERRYTPIHVAPAAPPGASRRAAAIQAAYASLVRLYPSQKSTFDTKLADSLAAIADEEADEHSESIARGVEWGQTVADAIWAWRSADGFTPPPPPFLGGLAVGQWRPTPPAFLPGAGPQFATMATWVIESASQFRPAGPPDLASARYAADFTETKTMGSLSSSPPQRGSDSGRPILEFDDAGLVLGRGSLGSRPPEPSDPFGALPPSCPFESRHGRRRHCLLGREIPLRLLAARDGDPAGGHRWKPRDRRGPALDAAHRDAGLSGIPIGPLHRQRRRGGRPRGLLRQRGRLHFDL